MFEQFTEQNLEQNYNLSQLKSILHELGYKPGKKNKQQLIEAILKIQNGERISVSRRGRPTNRDKQNRQEIFVSDHKTDFVYGNSVNGVFEKEFVSGNCFIRVKNLTPSKGDVFVPTQLVKEFGLIEGDQIEGEIEQKSPGVIAELKKITKINGVSIKNFKRISFDSLASVNSNQKINLIGGSYQVDMNLVQLFCPIAFGQRLLVATSENYGAKTILKKMAYSIKQNYKNAHVLACLFDTFPEEAEEFSFNNPEIEVCATSFAEKGEFHVRIFQLALSRAKRLVESGKNVVFIVDSIDKLAKAFKNMLQNPAQNQWLVYLKKFLASAKKTGDGSLTIIASCHYNQNQIFDEIKHSFNGVLSLSVALATQRIFPNINLIETGSQKEQILLSEEELKITNAIRRLLYNGELSNEKVIDRLNMGESLQDIVSRF